MSENRVLMTIEEQKKVQLDILKEIARFCEENNLRYFLTYGTLIGAVRHKGYIPWDDDIDIFMPREDYEKLIKTYNSNRKNEYCELISPLEKRSRHPFVKIIDTRTEKIEFGVEYTHLPLGVDIDVFPLDVALSDEEKFDNTYKKMKKLYHYMSFSIMKRGGRPLVKRMILALFQFVFPKVYFQKRIDRIIKSMSSKKTEYVSDVSCGFVGNGIRFRSEWFSDSCDVDFESLRFKAPIGYDEMLTLIYGDYMTPPPKDECVTHHLNNCFWKK